MVTEGDEQLLTSWVKVSPDNTVTAIIPHGEMGQGVHTALSAMLAEEMEADWHKMEIMEAPAEMDFTNFELIREFLLGDKEIPKILFDTVNGVSLSIAKAMKPSSGMFLQLSFALKKAISITMVQINQHLLRLLLKLPRQ